VLCILQVARGLSDLAGSSGLEMLVIEVALIFRVLGISPVNG
jgi:hypothetical protein